MSVRQNDNEPQEQLSESTFFKRQDSEIVVVPPESNISNNTDHAMSYPSLQGSFPNTQSNFVNTFVKDLDTPDKFFKPMNESVSSMSASTVVGLSFSQSTSTIETPNSSQPLNSVSHKTLPHSTSKIFIPPILPSTPSKSKDRSAICTKSLFLRFCCNIRNFLLVIFFTQSIFSIIVTVAFLFYEGQSFMDQTTISQYNKSFRILQSNLDEFLANVEIQSNIVKNAISLNLVNISSRSDVIRTLGSLQSVNQAGYITLYIDLNTLELTGIDRLNQTYLLTFNETGTQLFRATYNSTTLQLNPPIPSTFPLTYNALLSAWYPRTLAKYNGSVILHPPAPSWFDGRIILTATIMVAHPSNPSTYIGMFAFRYDIELFTPLLRETSQSFSESVALIIDNSCEIIATSAESPYKLKGLTLIPTFLFNSTNPIISAVGYNFKDNCHNIQNGDFSGYYIVVEDLVNDYSEDWHFMIITARAQFFNVIYSTGSLLALIAAVIILLAALVALIIFVNVITHSISMTADTLFKIAQLKIHPSPKKHLSVIYELRLLQESLNSIQIGLSSFAKYVPKSLVQSLLSEKQATIQLGVQPQNMTIMFCDIQDFTNKIEGMNSSILIEYLSHYFAVTTRIIERNSGVVDKFIGDAVLGFWNHPYGKVENHELMACKTALECVSLMENLSLHFQKKGLPSIKMRIGINSGNVLVGNVGSEIRYNYTVLGDVTNTASRLESLNKVFETSILIGQDTYEQVKEVYLCHWVELVQLKGKQHSIHVYELINWRHKATLDEIEIGHRLLQIRDCLDSNDFETMKQKSLLLVQDFPSKTAKGDYFYTKAMHLQTRPSFASLIDGRTTLLKDTKQKSFVMDHK